jgi:choline dehydrogenase-like flavoprotein
MEAAQKVLMETSSGPLTQISSMQGFFPYKLFATQEEQQTVLESVESSMKSVTPYQRKQYERTLRHLQDDKSANLQLVVVPATGDFVGGLQDQSRLFPPPSTPDQPHQFLAVICLAYPLSRGSIHIKSSDPFEHPAIDPNFMAHPADAKVAAAGLKMLEGVEHSKAMSGRFGSRVMPPKDFDLTKTEQGAAWARQVVASEYHPIGTCAIGDAVDSKLVVKGTSNIRVADGSVLPNHVSGNMVSAVYAVAEKAADIIKADGDRAAVKNVA